MAAFTATQIGDRTPLFNHRLYKPLMSTTAAINPASFHRSVTSIIDSHVTPTLTSATRTFIA